MFQWSPLFFHLISLYCTCVFNYHQITARPFSGLLGKWPELYPHLVNPTSQCWSLFWLTWLFLVTLSGGGYWLFHNQPVTISLVSQLTTDNLATKWGPVDQTECTPLTVWRIIKETNNPWLNYENMHHVYLQIFLNIHIASSEVSLGMNWLTWL